MSQYLSMIPSQQMRLEQRLTPQLIQSMEILQLPLLALEARVREELQSNPVLEEAAEPRAETDDNAPREDSSFTDEDRQDAESFERLDRLSRELELDPGDLPYGRERRGGDDTDAKFEALANTASRGISLQETLQQQWRMIEAPLDVKAAGEAIIEWIDDDGYLRAEIEQDAANRDDGQTHLLPLVIYRNTEDRRRLLEEISLSRTPPIDLMALDKALKLVQTLEPSGVGARDLAECLLIQLAARPDCDPLCAVLVRDHLIDLSKNRFPAVSRATGRPMDEIKDAMRLIGGLNHHPGWLVQPVAVQRIVPDVIVDYADDGEGYTVRLARGNVPHLRISPRYRQMLQQRSGDKEARDFIRKRIESASAIIDAIQYRRLRLLELARLVVDRQREFFDFGPQYIKVLLMRDVAKEFNCDPSTISRTVDGKYMQTPRGIFPIRMFFTGGTEDANGQEVSWDAIKARVKEIVDGEDKQNPLSDDAIVKILSEKSTVPIARRTVAKYRSQLGIPPARQRRAF